MLGSPLLRALGALAVLLLLMFPLRSFTAARPQASAWPVLGSQPSATAHLEIVSTKFPFAYSVKYLGRVLWQGESADSAVATDLRLPIPDEGVDLALSVTWQGDEIAAAKLSVAHDDRDPIERTVWGHGTVSDVLTFP